MYKFLLRPKWLAFHLLIIVLVVVMVNLAIWQVHRLQGRLDFNNHLRDNSKIAMQPIDEVLTADVVPKDIEWRQVEATGTYEKGTDLIFVNVSQYGTAGVDAISVLVMDDGSKILVNRGFVPLNEKVPAAPEGKQTVIGFLRRSVEHRAGALDNPSTGTLTELQRIDISRIDEQIEGDLAPMFIQSTKETNVAPYPVALPELTSGPHLSYAIQWCIFSICAIAGWVLVVRRGLKRRIAA